MLCRHQIDLLLFFIFILLYNFCGSADAVAVHLDPIVFNAKFYMEHYPELKLTSEQQATAHWNTTGFEKGLQGSPIFHCSFYLKNYSDLKKEFSSDCLQAATHFVQWGKGEGRKGADIPLELQEPPHDPDLLEPYVFDHVYYMAVHPELKDQGVKDEATARRHWLKTGLDAGLQGSNLFYAVFYLATYGDLKGGFGEKGYRAAALHWVKHGKREGRRGVPYKPLYSSSIDLKLTQEERLLTSPLVFDHNFYLRKYPSLRLKGIKTEDEAKLHWLKTGIEEGRQGNMNFDPVFYIESNPGIVLNGLNNYRFAIIHYVTEGHRAGRSGVSQVSGLTSFLPPVAATQRKKVKVNSGFFPTKAAKILTPIFIFALILYVYFYL